MFSFDGVLALHPYDPPKGPLVLGLVHPGAHMTDGKGSQRCVPHPGTDLIRRRNALRGGTCFPPQARGPTLWAVDSLRHRSPCVQSFVGQRRDCDLGRCRLPGMSAEPPWCHLTSSQKCLQEVGSPHLSLICTLLSMRSEDRCSPVRAPRGGLDGWVEASRCSTGSSAMLRTYVIVVTHFPPHDGIHIGERKSVRL